jgi:hypothetical protein
MLHVAPPSIVRMIIEEKGGILLVTPRTSPVLESTNETPLKSSR